MEAVFQRADGGLGVLTVVGADGDGVEMKRLVGNHFLVGGVIGFDVGQAVLFKKGLGLAGDQVAAGHDFDIGLL